MKFTIDPESDAPPYEQLRAQVLEAVREGRLVPGERLPTVRALADQLGLAANTVARAYRELEHDHLIETRGRSGSFVAAFGDPAHRRAQEAAAEYAALVRRLGVPIDDALDLVEAALRIGT
ncbi:GntR family transcriptional regulator [Agromyces larvae]|uniref:GntR family transcriptional regulator n=1 Tax=Agromyces larvae TaxID=2929802 RepID=A0ABY4BWR6_9MICO|nr:GntR family transcriptional regulator [Agromyces larvae]UOE43627.1 GntR family transcriptional regulator [Agromyces larvae]